VLNPSGCPHLFLDIPFLQKYNALVGRIYLKDNVMRKGTGMGNDFKRDNRTETFLQNIGQLIPNEIAKCCGVRFESSGRVVPHQTGTFGSVVGGCVLIGTALDIASSAAKGLKWSEYRGNERSEAMKEWVKNYLPSSYRAINWYSKFRSPLVHTFCPTELELTHHERFRPRHLKKVRVRGAQRICIHVFQFLEDLNEALKGFVRQVNLNLGLYKCVKRYANNYPVLEPRNPD
jgi:hypothetical protein